MARYEVYATRWDDPRIIEELLPARGLQFSMPLSGHGECSFTASVEPGRSFWRPAIAPVVSGLLVARDNVPAWCGWVVSEDQSGEREFSFRAVEWGAFFAYVAAGASPWSQVNDHQIFRDLVTRAQAVTGQDVAVEVGTSMGASVSDLTINAWDVTTVEEQFTQLANSEGGPEWRFGAAGTMTDPRRVLSLADRLGSVDPAAVLEYVEDTEDYRAPDGPPEIVLLSSLFPSEHTQSVVRRRGGNVLQVRRTRDSARSATVAVAVGSGEEKAQLRQSATSGLIAAGWPRLTRTETYSDVTSNATLLRHAQADLAAAEGLTTGYQMVTLDGEPDWTQVPVGSNVRVILDTDVYGAERPVGGSDGFLARVQGITVAVPDDGGDAQVQWDTATVQEAP